MNYRRTYLDIGALSRHATSIMGIGGLVFNYFLMYLNISTVCESPWSQSANCVVLVNSVSEAFGLTDGEPLA